MLFEQNKIFTENIICQNLNDFSSKFFPSMLVNEKLYKELEKLILLNINNFKSLTRVSK